MEDGGVSRCHPPLDATGGAFSWLLRMRVPWLGEKGSRKLGGVVVVDNPTVDHEVVAALQSFFWSEPREWPGLRA